MTIDRIEIEGFRTHANSILDVSTGINMIVGPNDAGKSNIIRALEWVFYNTPATETVIQFDAPHAKVSLHLDNGTKVERVRGKIAKGTKVNRYTIDRPGEEPKHFDAIGREVPEEVRQALGVSYFTEPGESIPCGLNISRQADTSFLLGQTGGKRASILNIFTGANYLDAGYKILRTEARDLEKRREYLDAEMAKIDREIAKYENLPDREKVLKELDALKREYEKVLSDRDEVRRLLWEIETAESEKGFLEGNLKKVDFDFSSVQRIWDDFKSTMDIYREITNTGNDIIDAEDRVEELEKRLKEAKIALKKAAKTADDLSGTIDLWTGIQGIVQDVGTLERAESFLGKQIDIKESELAETVSSYVEMLIASGVCPTCNGVPDVKRIEGMFG